MAHNAHIKPSHIEAIQNLIRTWDKKSITWDAVCEASELILGYRPSRSGLSSHVVLLEAFQARKRGLKVTPPENQPMPGSLAAAAQRIAAQSAEIAELRQTVGRLKEQFERWQYNATLHRMTQAQLNAPLPHLDRTL